MTDRFKFRVWNKRDELYEDIDDLYSYCIRQDGTFHLTEDGGCDINIDVNDYIIEQCTGLKDKNGKLIYEGDIIGYYDIYNDPEIGYNSCNAYKINHTKVEFKIRQVSYSEEYSCFIYETTEYEDETGSNQIYHEPLISLILNKQKISLESLPVDSEDQDSIDYLFENELGYDLTEWSIEEILKDLQIEIVGNIHENPELWEV